MTQKEKADALAGRLGDLETDGMLVGVRIVRGEVRYGRIDVLCEPLNGSGNAWVNAARVKLRVKVKEEPTATPYHAFTPALDSVCAICGCTENFAKHLQPPQSETATPSETLPRLLDGEVED